MNLPSTSTVDVAARRPGVEGWLDQCALLEAALRSPARRVLLHVIGASSPPEPLAGDVAPLVDAAARVQDALRGAGAVLVRASGIVAGPAVAVALAADVLEVEDGLECRLLEWQDRALLLPGDVSSLAARLGRPRAMSALLLGRPVLADELRARGGALPAGGGAGLALEGSARAQSLAARLLRTGAGGAAPQAALERAAFALCFGGPDRAEGVAAFAGRRAPRFGNDTTDDAPDGAEKAQPDEPRAP